MPFEIVFNPLADREYEAEYKWSVLNWGLDHADEFFGRIKNILSSLQESPFLYPQRIVDDLAYRVITLKGICIVYTVSEANREVSILAFVGRNRLHEIDDVVKTRMQ